MERAVVGNTESIRGLLSELYPDSGYHCVFRGLPAQETGARDRSPGRTAEQIPGDIRVALPLTESVTSHDEQPLQITPRKPAQEQILYWYAKVLKFIQKLAGLAPRPEQTMREFAEQTRTVSLLGPVSRYFNEMTLLTERFIYSPNKPTESDVEKSRELAQSINTEVENETI